MTEFIYNAAIGLKTYYEAGKLVALLAASLVFLFLYYKKEKQMPLLLYTAVIGLACTIPLSAAVLMVYQTKFYDYQWIWSYVPLVGVCAYAAVCLLEVSCGEQKEGICKKQLYVGGGLLLVLILSAGFGRMQSSLEEQQPASEQETTSALLAQMEFFSKDESVCLWAPQEFLTRASESESKVTFLYGRNMWDEWLNAYAYDTYPEDWTALFEWMEALCVPREERAEGEKPERQMSEMLEMGFAAGANCVLLPGEMPKYQESALEWLYNFEINVLDGYTLVQRRGN